MKKFWPVGLLIFGFLVIFCGFMYDILFAGIPYQDPTPAMVTRYNFHAQIASQIRWAGAGISTLGGVTLVIRRMVKKRMTN
ncbi:MAG: hypothetical protein D6706_00085 [Chloroflexi bacterium]|nr:MAG: hypothetical protein D6706_00085 [Chloroflexota bacterium]